jgi:tripartite ATP-independent transporter DctP family solute receptor
MNRNLTLLILTLLMLALVLLVLWPFGQSAHVQQTDQAPASDQLVLRFGYNIPERSALHLAAARFKERVEQHTEGRLRIDLFPNQVLGNDHQMLEMARRGELDLLLIPTAKLSTALPEMQYADLPFLLPTRQALYAMLDGEPGRLLLEKMNKINMVGVTFWGNGFKHFTANQPLRTPEDFAGLDIRIMKSRLLRDQFNLMGAEAIPIDFHETRQALLDGVVDGQENPLVAIHGMGIHEVQSDLTLSEHAYLAYIFAISGKRFNQLPGHLQTLLLETAREITPWQRSETERQEAEFLAEIEAQGTRIHRLSEAERLRFQRVMQPLADRFETVIGSDILAYTQEYAALQDAGHERWLIGIDTDLSSVSPTLSLEIKRGAQLAIERFQRQDSMLTRDIHLITRDNRNLAGRSSRNLEDFMHLPGMLGIIAGIGPLSFQAGRAGSELVLPVINPWMSHPDLFASDSRLINLVAPPEHIAERVVQPLKERGIGSIRLLTETTPWSEALAGAIEASAKANNMDVQNRTVLDPTQPVAAKLDLPGTNGVDAVILVLQSRLLPQTLKWYETNPSDTLLVSTTDWTLSPRMPEVLTLQSHNAAPGVDEIVEAYTSRYATPPASIATLIQAYDAGWILMLAATRCEAGLYPNMQDALREIVPCEQLVTDVTATENGTGQFKTHLAPAWRQPDASRGTP